MTTREKGRWTARLLTGALTISLQLLAASTVMAEQDHLKGYKIKDLNQVVPPANPYTMDGETCELKKPQFLLNPSEKNGLDDPRGVVPGNFVCYKAKCTGTLPPVTDVDSQFGLHSLEFKKVKLVCLPVDPPPPPCAGQIVGGFCWFLGAVGDSCDTTCAAQALTCDPATVTYAGTGGSLSQCDAVLDALVGPGSTIDVPNAAPVGCVYNPVGVQARLTGSPTTCAGTEPTSQRACACN